MRLPAASHLLRRAAAAAGLGLLTLAGFAVPASGVAAAQRRQRAARRERVRVPDRRPDAVQPAQRGRRVLEGIRPGSRRRPEARLHAVPAEYGGGSGGRSLRRGGDAGQQPGHQSHGHVRRFPARRHDLHRGAAERPVRGQAPPVLVVRVPDRCRPLRWYGRAAAERAVPRRHQLRPPSHRQPRQPRRGSLPRPAEGQDDPGLQLDHPGHVQRRARRRVPGQQPLRGLQRQRDAGLQLADPPATPSRPRRRTTPAACTPPTCSSSTTSR